MPKDFFPNSDLSSRSEWPEDSSHCVFDYHNVRCPFGEQCKRRHDNNPKPSSTSATDGSDSPAIRALDVKMRRLTAQKAQLLAAQEDSPSSDESEEEGSWAPLPPILLYTDASFEPADVDVDTAQPKHDLGMLPRGKLGWICLVPEGCTRAGTLEIPQTVFDFMEQRTQQVYMCELLAAVAATWVCRDLPLLLLLLLLMLLPLPLCMLDLPLLLPLPLLLLLLLPLPLLLLP